MQAWESGLWGRTDRRSLKWIRSAAVRFAGVLAALVGPSALGGLPFSGLAVHGIGHVAVGMHRQGYDLQLTQHDERGWRATFYTTGMEHSPTSA